MPSMLRGGLIVIEGLDRAGKSTQCEKLSQALQQQGHRSTPIGQSIDAYLRGESHQEDHAIHLLFSANRWEAARQIKEDIGNGITIIIDRYYYSGIVYSVAKERQDLSLDWATQPDVGLPKPDLCIFLDLSPGDAATRGGFGTERYETNEMQKRVRALFKELLKAPKNNEMVSVDASQPVQEVHETMLQLANKMFHGKPMHHPMQIFEGH
ncbi:MAG: hypothetical protein LQ343_005281 [Gyalolechia ehrenbergii]|nr:MAG: hypothetical protein LQ343_005281 [Gyalolechia ehrenbergii]